MHVALRQHSISSSHLILIKLSSSIKHHTDGPRQLQQSPTIEHSKHHQQLHPSSPNLSTWHTWQTVDTAQMYGVFFLAGQCIVASQIAYFFDGDTCCSLTLQLWTSLFFCAIYGHICGPDYEFVSLECAANGACCCMLFRVWSNLSCHASFEQDPASRAVRIWFTFHVLWYKLSLW